MAKQDDILKRTFPFQRGYIIDDEIKEKEIGILFAKLDEIILYNKEILTRLKVDKAIDNMGETIECDICGYPLTPNGTCPMDHKNDNP